MDCNYLGLPSELVVFFTSMLPVIELRGSIPLGIACGMHPVDAFTVSLLGNYIIIFPILYLLPWIVKIFKKIHPLLDKWLTKFLEKTQHKHSHKMEVYGALALILLVAVPLPGTGAWTGSIVSYIFGIPKYLSFIYILLGLIIAGLIVSGISFGFTKIV